MQGTLFRYGPGSSQLAFISGGPRTAAAAHPPRHHSRHVVLMGGLTDGLLFSSYVAPLGQALDDAGWSLVQAQLSSSYAGYGHASLDQDADELLQLCSHLARGLPLGPTYTPPPPSSADSTGSSTSGAGSTAPSQGIVLMGHSTGCQDICRFMSRYASKLTVKGSTGGTGQAAQAGDEAEGPSQEHVPDSSIPLLGCVLQAPVSDREWLGMFPELEEVGERAKDMIAQGKGDEIVCRLHVAGGAPITASRFSALYHPGGDDDMFSADLSQQQLEAILSPVGALPCLVLASGADEAAPPGADIAGQAHRIAASISAGGQAAQLVVVEGAPHALAGHEQEAVEAVLGFCGRLTPA